MYNALFSTKISTHAKKQNSVTIVKGKKQARETIFDEGLMMYLAGKHKHFKIATINMFKALNKPVLQMMKERYNNNVSLKKEYQ